MRNRKLHTFEQSNQIWYKKQVESHGIDVNKNRRSKKGIEGFFASIPGFIDDNLNYKGLEDGLGQKIDAQTPQSQLMINKPEEIYDKDVQIIIKNGKYYYLHEEPNSYL